MTTTIKRYRNITTGELAPAHRLGTDETGDPIYQSIEGWEPTVPYWTDEDGLWHAEGNSSPPTIGELCCDAINGDVDAIDAVRMAFGRNEHGL